jgi:hypothetical protein
VSSQDPPSLPALIESARAYQPTAAEREAQRQSFAKGNVAMSQDEERKTVPEDATCGELSCDDCNTRYDAVRQQRDDALAELARERRRTASLVKAGDELAWECVTDDDTYIHGEDGEEIRGIKAAVEAWDTARAALAGPGGDETAGSGLDGKP